MIFKLSLTFKVCILNEGIHEEIEGEVIWEYSILDLHTEISKYWHHGKTSIFSTLFNDEGVYHMQQ